jgi:hypothetical protein
MKVPISDTFDELASLSSNDDTQFQKIASFIVSDPISNEEQQKQKSKMEPFLIKRLFNDVRC